MPERFGRLPGKGPSAGIGNSPRNHDRQAPTGLGEDVVQREQRGLGIQGVEHGLDHDEVGPTVDESACGFAVGLDKVGEPDVACSRVVDVGGDAGRTVGGSEYAGDPPGLGIDSELVHRSAGDLRRREVHLVDRVLQPVIRLGDAGGRESIRLDDVRAGLEVGSVGGLDDIGPGEGEHVAVTLERRVVAPEPLAPVVLFLQAEALLHGAGGTIQYQQALRQRLRQGMTH